MRAEAQQQLWKRQGGDTFSSDGGGDGSAGYGYGDYSSSSYGDAGFWWTPAGMAVRYAIVGLLFAALLLFFVGGWFHARRRLRKGLPPLAYHRWMVSRYYYRQPHDAEAPPQRQLRPVQQTYRMEHYEPPPPAYNQSEVPPPVYQPPEGASKVAADQTFVRVRPTAGEASERSDPPALPAVVVSAPR